MNGNPTADEKAGAERSTGIGSFYALALGISWAGWIPYGAAQAGVLHIRVPCEVTNIAEFGPTLAAFALTVIAGGREGFRQFLVRSCRWRIGLRWYAFALLLSPAIGALWLLVHATFGHNVPGLADFRELLPRYVESLKSTGPYGFDRTLQPSAGPMAFVRTLAASNPGWAVLVFVSFLTFSGPVSEEFGWRGYALPRLQTRQGALRAAVSVGLLWGAWHTLPDFWRLLFLGKPGAWLIPIAITTGTVPLSILFTWMSNRTGGSILPAMLFHGSFNTTVTVLTLLWVGRPKVLIGAEMVVVLWLAAMVLVLISGSTLGREHSKNREGRISREAVT